MNKFLIIMLVFVSSLISDTEKNENQFVKAEITKDNPSEEGLKIYNFVMSYVEDAYGNDQVPISKLNSLKQLSLERIRDNLLSFYCLLKRDVPYFLGRLEALEKERLMLKKARSILDEQYNLQVDYSIYLVNNFIQKEVASYNKIN